VLGPLESAVLRASIFTDSNDHLQHSAANPQNRNGCTAILVLLFGRLLTVNLETRSERKCSRWICCVVQLPTVSTTTIAPLSSTGPCVQLISVPYVLLSGFPGDPGGRSIHPSIQRDRCPSTVAAFTLRTSQHSYAHSQQPPVGVTLHLEQRTARI